MALLDIFKGLPFGGGGSAKGQSVLGVDIGSSSIKVVQLRRARGAAVLETYGEISLAPYGGFDIGRATNLAPEKIAQALGDLAKEANVTTKNCGVSIPFSSSLIAIAEMPNLPQKRLGQMIPIEARKYIPVPMTEIELDWFVIPEEEAKYFVPEGTDNPTGAQNEAANKVHVLLVAIHKDILTKYRQVFTTAGFAPTFFEIEAFSAIRAIIEGGAAPTAVLDIGAAMSKLYIVEYGIVRASHNISRGSQDITISLSKSSGMSIAKAEEMKRGIGLSGDAALNESARSASHTVGLIMEYIFSETRRAILSYQKHSSKDIANVILTGGGASLPGILDLAKKSFDMNISLAQPFTKVEAPAFLEATLREAGPTFSVAVGLALRKLQEFS